MFGTIITAGVGVLGFKLGADAYKLRNEGRTTTEIAKELASSTVTDAVNAANFIKEKVQSMFGCN